MNQRSTTWSLLGRLFVGALCLPPVAPNAAAEMPLSVRVEKAKPALDVRPEYERRLNRVLLSFPTLEDSALSPERQLLVRAAYEEVFRALPSHASFVIAFARDDDEAVRGALSPLGTGRAVHMQPVSSGLPDLWAQDIGEPVLAGTERKFLVSRVNTANDAHYWVTKDRREAAVALFGKDAVVEAGFVFEGGNLAFDRTAQGLRVLMGYDDVLATMRADAAKGRPSRLENVLERVSRSFSGAEVVLLGRGPQSPYLFHLDQAFVLLEGGVAVVASIVDEPSSREHAELLLYRTQLETLGYEIHDIPHAADDIRRYRNSVNAVPFVDAAGTRQILFPVFPGELAGEGRGPVNKVDLVGKGLKAFEVYQRAGYEPIPVRDFTAISRGNLHCVVNALD